MTAIDYAYLAGLFDGEGSVSISKSNGWYRLSISVTQTDLLLLKTIEEIAGCGSTHRIKTKRQHKRAWRWDAWSNQAADVLQNILPYLRLKRLRASYGIVFQSKMRATGRAGLTNQEKCEQKKLFKTLKNLNKRGR